MKKIALILCLFMAVIVVNAQSTPTPLNNSKAVRTEMMVSDLLKPITDNIAKDFAGYTIKDATSVMENSIITYEVVVFKGTVNETLVYDKNGLFLSKIPAIPQKV